MSSMPSKRSFFSVSAGAPLHRWLVCGITVAALSWVAVGVAGAQETPPKPAKRKELPKPQQLGGEELLTTDGVQLSATYYPGTEGKDTVPIILLHSWKGDSREFGDFPKFLQGLGHAVLVPDLRGHGDSNRVVVGGIVREIDPAKLPSDQFENMVYKDMEKLKGFLVRENDKGELNLSKLCIVGAEMGASVATYYARYDWMLSRYEPASRKKAPAADVKALVLMSPDWDFRGLPMKAAISHPAVQRLISILIIVGKGDSRVFADANRLHGMLERYRPEPPRGEAAATKNLFFVDPDIKLQGAGMLGVEGVNMEGIIAKFIELRLDNQDFAWRQRG